MAKLSNFHRGIMGTIEFDGLFVGMRKPQSFIVYPMKEASEKIIIQSDTRFGAIFIPSGEVLLSASHSNGAYSHTLIADQIRGRAVKDQVSPEDLAALTSAIAGTAGSEVGRSFVKTDNSGAAAFAKPAPVGSPAPDAMGESLEQLSTRQFVDEMLEDHDPEEVSGNSAYDIPDEHLRKWVVNDPEWYARAVQFGGGGDDAMWDRVEDFVAQNREELIADIVSKTGERYRRESVEDSGASDRRIMPPGGHTVQRMSDLAQRAFDANANGDQSLFQHLQRLAGPAGSPRRAKFDQELQRLSAERRQSTPPSYFR